MLSKRFAAVTYAEAGDAETALRLADEARNPTGQPPSGSEHRQQSPKEGAGQPARNPDGGASVSRLAVLGIISAVLYGVLFLYEAPILSISAQGQWMFIIPVVIAFVFSYVHGAFTGLFWDVLGIKAKG
ncbi:MAG: hypothetical protein WCZ20_09465 [Hydrogenophaga sp.]|nr:hypothetical protein [Gammaproteobacteria bacterium]